MTGLKVTLPTTFTDNTLPILRDDPILPSSGALLLVDMSTDTTTAIPTSLQNVAAPQAATLLNVDPSVVATAALHAVGTYDATKLVLQRSTKGGLHGIANPTLADGNGHVIETPSALLDYLYANPTHSLYVSVWDRATRVTNAGQGAGVYAIGGASEAAGVLAYIHRSGLLPEGGTGTPGISESATVGTPFRLSVAPTHWWYNNGGPYTPLATLPARNTLKSYVNFGRANSVGFGAPHSHVFYRLYVEDLTVSGRTAAAVQALDVAQFNAAFSGTGRFSGDTYNDPQTVIAI